MKPRGSVKPPRGTEDYRVQVLNRVFGILDQLAIESRDLGSTEIAKRIGLHKSTTHRLLAVLEHNRFVEKNPATSKYRLGWRLFELGTVVMSGVDLYEHAKPELRDLVERTGETAHLGVFRQGKVVSICNVESRRSVRTPSTVGRQTPFHCTSQGKAILAFLPQASVGEMLRRYQFQQFTKNTISSQLKFKSELALVRKRGYAIDDEEFEEGLRCIGAPVLNHSHEVVAAISIAGPSYRITGSRIPELSQAVQHAAARLSSFLGYRAKPSGPGPKSRKKLLLSN